MPEPSHLPTEQENLLNRKITGLTWGIVLTIITVFGSGAVAMTTVYVNMVKEMATIVVVMEQMKANQERYHQEELKKNEEVNGRICIIEGKLMPQATYSR